MTHKKAIAMLLGASVLWSFAGICIKSMSWNGFAITGMRGLIAAAVLLFAIKKPRLPRGKYQILSILSYVGLICLMVIATKMTTAANAILLQYTSPVYSAVLGWFILHERAVCGASVGRLHCTAVRRMLRRDERIHARGYGG